MSFHDQKTFLVLLMFICLLVALVVISDPTILGL